MLTYFPNHTFYFSFVSSGTIWEGGRRLLVIQRWGVCHAKYFTPLFSSRPVQSGLRFHIGTKDGLDARLVAGAAFL
jgi:hypothetical protein